MKKLILLLMLMGQSAFAEDVLAHKEHQMQFSYLCQLYRNHVRVQMLNGNVVIEEKTKIDSEFIEKNFREIVDGASPVRYQWAMGSIGYYVQQRRFKSYGFENVSNSSPKARRLEEMININCENVSSKLKGTFDLKVDLGSGIINDVLLLKQQSGSLTGSYSYPGHFEEKITDITYKEDVLKFKFKLKEGNKPEMNILVDVEFSDKDHFSGTLYIDSTPHPISGKRR